MILKLIVDDQILSLEVPQQLLEQAADFFAQMDRDMDRGWQMSRDWVNNPDQLQRCQIVTDKLLSAMEKENDNLGRLMAGYILSRLPDIDTVDADTHGEMQNTQFSFKSPAPVIPDRQPQPPSQQPGALTELEAELIATQQVSNIFQVGANFRFSVLDAATGQWQDSAEFPDAQQAKTQRQQALQQRFAALLDATR